MNIDPTTIRLSDTIMLSDAIGCDSAYRYGHANPFRMPDNESHLAEARKLADHIEELQENEGPCSISYGFISDSLSRKIVKYQDPTKPSYHRWDDGAAMDLCFHDWKQAPIYMAFEIDSMLEYSRLITYAESSWICLATRVKEGKKGRKAFYENRYLGKREPEHVKVPMSPKSRQVFKDKHFLEHEWYGQGYPSYHGGGRRQLHHIRVSRYVVLSDLLYYSRFVNDGVQNIPPFTQARRYAEFLEAAETVGECIDRITDNFGCRFSIARAYIADLAGTGSSNWEIDGVSFELIPPAFIKADDVAQWVYDNTEAKVRTRKAPSGIERVMIYV